MLKNNTGTEEPFILINGAASGATVKAEGTGLEKNIRVTFATPMQIGPDGMLIEVYNKPVAITAAAGLNRMFTLAVANFRIAANQVISYSVNADGPVSMELLSLNGAKIGTIMRENLAAGNHSFKWNGKTLEGKKVGSSFAILRLTSVNGSVSRTVFAGR